MKTTKEIIGYKVKGGLGFDALNAICKLTYANISVLEGQFKISGYHLPVGYDTIRQLEKFGVRDLWMEPVQKETFELKVGKWYKSEISETLFNYQKDQSCYGFFLDRSYWVDKNWEINPEAVKDFPLASDEEVGEALINVAERRYKNNRYKCLSIFGPEDPGELSDFFYSSETNCLWQIGELCNQLVFDNGKWADILPKNKN